MKKFLTFGLVVFTALLCISCGTSTKVPVEDEAVNVGYGRVKKSDLPYAVDKVKMNNKTTDAYTDMYDYLRGRVPGVNVGPDNSITIRGVNSINSSTEPLIILDGSPITDLSIINPKDVESVEVLKDASSSIYGVRGANGVILITSKH